MNPDNIFPISAARSAIDASDPSDDGFNAASRRNFFSDSFVLVASVAGSCASRLRYTDMRGSWRQTVLLWGPIMGSVERRPRPIWPGLTQLRKAEVGADEIDGWLWEWWIISWRESSRSYSRRIRVEVARWASSMSRLRLR